MRELKKAISNGGIIPRKIGQKAEDLAKVTD
jgi:hypothetical protein